MDDTFKLLLESVDASDYVEADFFSKYHAVMSGDQGVIDLSECLPLKKGQVSSLVGDTASYSVLGESLLSKVGFLKLAGGLGTSMGCHFPKSLVYVDASRRFMDVILDQWQFFRSSYGVDFPLVVLTSFYTHSQLVSDIPSSDGLFFVKQHQYPVLDAHSGAPFQRQGDVQWAPPGHGDVFLSLLDSGLLDELMSSGIEYLFLSNSDNLGACFDPALLGVMQSNEWDFMMEVTQKTPLDVKGGVVALCQDRPTLVERYQVGDATAQFEDLDRFPYFNTNNIWVRLDRLKHLLESGSFRLPLIVNRRTVDGESVMQLESAMGAAISLFDRSGVVSVSRDRFIPVKTTNDLFVVRSDVIQRDSNGFYRWSRDSEGRMCLPKVALSDRLQDVAAFDEWLDDDVVIFDALASGEKSLGISQLDLESVVFLAN